MHNPQRKRQAIGGYLERYDGPRGSTWTARLRLPDGRKKNVRLGSVWSGKGRPPTGFLTKRGAQDALRALIADAQRGLLPGLVRPTDVTFAAAAEEWLIWGESERAWRASTARDYRGVVAVHLLPAFGTFKLEEITPRMIERWRTEKMAAGKLGRRSAAKAVMLLGQIFKRARKLHGLQANPVDEVERLRQRHDRAAYNYYEPEEIRALVRAAASEQDAAIFLTAGFAGLRRGELLGLRVKDVDFDGQAIRVERSYDAEAPGGGMNAPKSGRSRVVPMVDEVATALARLLQREHFVGPDDLIFPGVTGEPLDPSALRRRYTAAQKRGRAEAAAIPRFAALIWHRRDLGRHLDRRAALARARRPRHDRDL